MLSVRDKDAKAEEKGGAETPRLLGAVQCRQHAPLTTVSSSCTLQHAGQPKFWKLQLRRMTKHFAEKLVVLLYAHLLQSIPALLEQRSQARVSLILFRDSLSRRTGSSYTRL
jgi:hypothetical protein